MMSEGADMDLYEALAAKIAEYDSGSVGEEVPGFDAWDDAARDYLEAVCKSIADGESALSVYERMKADLPRLEERVEAEEASYTFDWYDDHYYLKIYSGQVQACKFVLSLCETLVSA